MERLSGGWRASGWACGLMLVAFPMTGLASPDGFLRHGGANVTSLSTGSTGLAASLANPAAGSILLGDDQKRRVGILSLPHFGFEVGPVDNFADDFESFEERLEMVEDQIEQAEQSGDPNDAQEADSAIRALIDDFNPVLRDIVDNGYVNVEFQQQLPVTPALIRGFDGVFSVNVSADLKAQIETVAATNEPGIVDGLDTNNDGLLDEVETNDLAAVVTSGLFATLGVGYSRPIPPQSWLPLPEGMTLQGGGRLNIVQGRLSKQIAVVDDEDDDSEEDTAFDRVEDNYDANETSKTSFGVDVGVLGQWRDFTFGATIFNLIPPQFEFGEFGTNCGRFDPNSGQRQDCETTRDLIAQGIIDGDRDYKPDTRLNVEAAYDIPKIGWTVGGTLDLTKATSVFGDEYQWFELVAALDSGRWWLPDAAFSFRQNLAGTDQSYLTAGVGLLRVFRLNISYGLENAEVDGDSVPRSAAIGLGFEIPF